MCSSAHHRHVSFFFFLREFFLIHIAQIHINPTLKKKKKGMLVSLQRLMQKGTKSCSAHCFWHLFQICLPTEGILQSATPPSGKFTGVGSEALVLGDQGPFWDELGGRPL